MIIGGMLLLRASEAAVSPDSSGFDTILLVLTSTGLTGVVVAIISAVVNRKKMKAESVNIISQAAGNMVDRLEDENLRIIGERDTARDRVADLEIAAAKAELEREELREKILVHKRWDLMAVEKLAELGVEIDPPPGMSTTP